MGRPKEHAFREQLGPARNSCCNGNPSDLFGPPLGSLKFTMTDRVTCLQVLGVISIGQSKFTDMQREFRRIHVEHEEAVRAVAKYKEDLFNFKNELKEANEMVRHRNDSILNVERRGSTPGLRGTRLGRSWRRPRRH